MTAINYLDTNIILRFITEGKKTPDGYKSYIIFKRIASGEILAKITESVFVEIFYVLESKKQPYKMNRADIYNKISLLVRLKNLYLFNKDIAQEALNIYIKNNNLDIEDAILLAYSQSDNADIITFDKELIKVFKLIHP